MTDAANRLQVGALEVCPLGGCSGSRKGFSGAASGQVRVFSLKGGIKCGFKRPVIEKSNVRAGLARSGTSEIKS